MKSPDKTPGAGPSQPDPMGGFNDWTNAALNGVLDLILGPPTEDELRDQSTAVPGAAKKRRKRTKKLDDHPVDFALKVRTEAHNILDRLHRREAMEKEEAARKASAAQGNSKQLVWLGILQIIQLFAVSQATMLVVFIPQKCPAINASIVDSPMFDYTQNLVDGHLCSLKENIDWFNMTEFNRACLVVNAFTLILVLSAMGYFWMRECWLVDHLEESAEVPYDNLVTEFQAYPLIEAVLVSLNSWAYVFATVTATTYVANFVLSTVFLFKGDGTYNYSLGPRTATSLVTNTMLIAGKIVGYLSYSRLSYKNKWAVSIFSTMPMSFNALDANYK